MKSLPDLKQVNEKGDGKRKMMLFDPWPVFFKREWKRCWPFLTGFADTGVLITKLTAGLTEEDAKNSKFCPTTQAVIY
jgi:hypothetical protein